MRKDASGAMRDVRTVRWYVDGCSKVINEEREKDKVGSSSSPIKEKEEDGMAHIQLPEVSK